MMKFVVVAISLASVGICQAQTWSLTSGTQQAQLVELFTSEGCNSCPPADSWLSSMKQRTDLFESVVPVAYHVTYWDYLGWEDTLGLAEHDTRHRQQAAYAGSGVYTPGVFLQGGEWRSWRRKPQGPIHSAPAEIGVLQADAEGEYIDVTFTPAPGVEVLNPEVFVTYLRMDESTQVRAGENRGRVLKHDFVAGAVVSQPMRRQTGRWHATVFAPPSAAADAVALWVKQADGQFLQASGTRLPTDSP